MATIAQGMITLNSVNDAFSVSLSPSSCVINADYNGKNPKLEYAYTDIEVVRGETKVAFEPVIIRVSNSSTCTLYRMDNTRFRLKIDKIPTTDLSGAITVHIKVGSEFETDVTFAYTVVRETSMLDWILDWNGTYTEITGKWVITPKLFAGTKNAEGQITGVYMGPAFDNSESTGLYGYKDDEVIFELTETGGVIGGWEIKNNGIFSKNGNLRILSSGTIGAYNQEGDAIWRIDENGNAFFAFENVRFYANGDAEFAGKITSKEGSIGGWNIGEDYIISGGVVLDSDEMLIGVINQRRYTYTTGTKFVQDVKTQGGVYILYSDTNDYGIWGYSLDSKLVFNLGSNNQIAGWKFDYESLYLGAKNNTARQNTSASGAVTIGTNGLRGQNWYIDSDGEISFVGGLLHFDKDGGTMAGWNIYPYLLATNHVALVSASGEAGLYLSVGDFINKSQSLYSQVISRNGGIYIKTDSANSQIAGYAKIDSQIKRVFLINSHGSSHIGNWYFTDQSLYIGTQKDAAGNYTGSSGHITLGSTGIRGYKWRLEADGSGAIAGGHISWNTNGDITLDNTVKIAWNNVTGTDGVMTKGTYFDANGIFTGQINADLIKTGKLKADRIDADELFSVEGKWALLRDGSGYLASKNITWDTNGKLSVKGTIEADSGSIAGFKISSGFIGMEADANGSASTGSQATWASLSIYKDFFKVGGDKGYVMFGNDVIPSSAGGAFTAVGRIVNNAINTMGSYGWDQANYGLFLDVTGGTKNYGISSNAALKAPAFINTEAKILTFSGTSYSVDFSQHTIFLMYYNNPNYSGTEVTLPSESSVARQFGLSTLPDNFAIVLTFRVRTGSQNITLKGIYNQNESSTDYKLGPGDSVQVLVSKIDGFRYQILNHTA